MIDFAPGMRTIIRDEESVSSPHISKSDRESSC